jgi:hypothetical protein
MITTDTLIDTMAGAAPPAYCTPESFQEAVLAAVARAKAAVPAAERRIDTAAALVLAGAVELLEEGRTARVGSHTDGGPVYVVNGQCSCPEFPTAPGHWCTHRLAYGIAKRATALLQASSTPLSAPSGPGAWGPSDALNGHAAEAAEADPGDTGLPSEQRATAALQQETALPAQYLQLIDGKPFVKYAGLLTMAHAQGLQQLEAWFTGVSDTLAVAQATATFRDGRRFSESGEATPENVGRQVRPHFARLALTRAKARCLRDALNIALCAVEELGGESADGALRRPLDPGSGWGRESASLG